MVPLGFDNCGIENYDQKKSEKSLNNSSSTSALYTALSNLPYDIPYNIGMVYRIQDDANYFTSISL